MTRHSAFCWMDPRLRGDDILKIVMYTAIALKRGNIMAGNTKDISASMKKALQKAKLDKIYQLGQEYSSLRPPTSYDNWLSTEHQLIRDFGYLFEVRADLINQQQNNKLSLEDGPNSIALKDYTGEIPPEYICPLSLQIMSDPVKVQQHPMQRFERAWIQAHLQRRADNPLNRERLVLSDLLDDNKLKTEIDEFVALILNINKPSVP